MTSNQIANAANIENRRHNAAYEEETQRHNQQTEEIQKESNRITEEYNTHSLQLQDWYNTAYINYLNAAEEDKVNLETQLNEIKMLQAEADKEYKQAMAGLEERKTEVDEMYKNALSEQIAQNQDIEYKRLYYENQKTEAYVKSIEYNFQIAQQNLEKDYTRIMNDYSLGLINENTKQQQLQNVINQFQFEMTKWQQSGYYLNQSQIELLQRQQDEILSRTAKNYSDIGSSWVDAFAPF